MIKPDPPRPWPFQFRSYQSSLAGRTAPTICPLLETWRLPPAPTVTARNVSVPTLPIVVPRGSGEELAGVETGAMKITPWGRTSNCTARLGGGPDVAVVPGDGVGGVRLDHDAGGELVARLEVGGGEQVVGDGDDAAGGSPSICSIDPIVPCWVPVLCVNVMSTICRLE